MAAFLRLIMIITLVLTTSACGEKPKGPKQKLKEMGIPVEKSSLFEQARANNLETLDLLFKTGLDPLSINEKNGQTLLLIALENDQQQLLQAILTIGQNDPRFKDYINHRNKKGVTPVLYAVEEGDLELLDTFLALSADPEITDKEQNSLLHLAIKKNDNALFEKVFTLPGAETMLNSRNASLETPLMLAIKENATAFITPLLDKGANPNIADRSKATPLMVAARNNNIKLISQLLEKGAEVNVMDVQGKTPLIYGIEHNNPEMVDLLLQAGADPNLTKEEGFTPLQQAIMEESTDFALISSLIANGADPHQTPYGKPNMYYALEQGRLDVVKILAENNLSVNELGEESDPPLILALESGNEELALYVLNHEVNVNGHGQSGMSPIEIAVKNGMKRAVDRLIEKNAFVNVKTRDGFKPADIAVYKGYQDILESLLAAGGQLNSDYSLIRSIIDGNQQIVEVLLQYGANTNVMNRQGEPAIWLAASRGQKQATRALIQYETPVNQPSKKDGTTPLAIAAKHGSDEIVQLLLRAGANTEIPDRNGMTALAHAVTQNRLDPVISLIAAGANVNARDAAGRSILERSISGTNHPNKQAITELLVQAGAKR